MEIRHADLADIRMVLDWAAQEGWNPGLDDAAAFYAADPEGFFLGCIDGAPVAAISVVNHTDAFAFLGLYIVRSEARGQGYGKRLWDHAIDHAGGRTIGLDGVPAQQANYQRSGFVSVGQTARFTGKAQGRRSALVRTAKSEDIARLIAQEAAQSGVAKPRYLSAWCAATKHRQTYVLAEPQDMKGHATLRRCREGHKIGPLCAESLPAAELLLDHCLALSDGPVSIDVPQSAQTLRNLCADRAFSVGFETARMYRGPAPEAAPELFAVTTLELG